mgnify:CR=1 FL=1
MDDKLTGNKTNETYVNQLVDLHNQLAHMNKYKKNDKIKNEKKIFFIIPQFNL